MFKVNNKNTRTTSTSMTLYFTSFSSASVVDIEQVKVKWKKEATF